MRVTIRFDGEGYTTTGDGWRGPNPRFVELLESEFERYETDASDPWPEMSFAGTMAELPGVEIVRSKSEPPAARRGRVY